MYVYSCHVQPPSPTKFRWNSEALHANNGSMWPLQNHTHYIMTSFKYPPYNVHAILLTRLQLISFLIHAWVESRPRKLIRWWGGSKYAISSIDTGLQDKSKYLKWGNSDKFIIHSLFGTVGDDVTLCLERSREIRFLNDKILVSIFAFVLTGTSGRLNCLSVVVLHGNACKVEPLNMKTVREGSWSISFAIEAPKSTGKATCTDSSCSLVKLFKHRSHTINFMLFLLKRKPERKRLRREVDAGESVMATKSSNVIKSELASLCPAAWNCRCRERSTRGCCTKILKVSLVIKAMSQ